MLKRWRSIARLRLENVAQPAFKIWNAKAGTFFLDHGGCLAFIPEILDMLLCILLLISKFTSILYTMDTNEMEFVIIY